MKKRKSLDFSHSMNDLMASLAAVFLILFAGLIIAKKNDEAAKEDKIELVKADIYKDIVNELGLKEAGSKKGKVAEKDCVRVNANTPGRVRISFFSQEVKSSVVCDGLTFDEGDYVLSEPSIELINTKITNILKKICSPGRLNLVSQVSVVGHSDVKPQASRGKFSGCGPNGLGFKKSTNETFCNNYSLSAKRAESVYFVLRNAIINSNFAPIPFERIIECADQKFVTQGRGPTHPNVEEGEVRIWTGEDTFYHFNEIDRAKDRRVEIEIVLKEAAGV